MAGFDTHDTWPISNADVTPVDDCLEYKLTASKLLRTPAHPRLSYLKSNGLVFVPFPEREALDHYADRIYLNWLENFRSGIVVLADHSDGEHSEKNPARRYFNCARFRFRDALSFRNGGFYGAFLLWIACPKVCLSIFVTEYSGFVCPPELVEPFFGAGLSVFVDEFSTYAHHLDEREGRRFFLELAELYRSQWAIADLR